MATIQCKDKQFTEITAIIFDKDGTLADSQHYLRELAQRRSRLIDAQVPGVGEPLLMAFGLLDGELNPTGLMAVGSHHENAIAAAAYVAETGRSWFESLAIVRQAFDEANKILGDRASTSPLFTGSLEVIRYCHDAGLKQGILSMDSTANIESFVKIYQLDDYIQLRMGAEAGLKPDPDLFRKACAALGAEPRHTLMIGDAPGDIEMAKAAGAAGTIGICWGNPSASHLDQADVAISSLDALQII